MSTYLFEFLRKKCEEKGFFYSQLEDKADLSHSVVKAIKTGRTQLKPATKQKLAAALGLTIGDIQDAIRRSDEILESGEVLKKHVPEEPVTVPEPEPHCPYDDPVKAPAAGPQDKPWIPEKETPEYPKENPELTKAVVQQVVEDAIRADCSVIVKTVKEQEKDGPDILPNEIVAMRPMPKKNDNVNHPSHYTQGAVECIEAIKASMTRQEYIGYLKGCQMKYVWRYRKKGGVEDLKKARWYLDRLITEVEGHE